MADNRVQELLDQAGSEYNQGKYSEAIEHWQAVLSLDPENQKAREGIRMAKLLVVNWETSQGGGEELTLETGGIDPQTQKKIEFGIGRVRELLAAGRHKEAMEGCQLLAELAPGMPSVAQLQEEITHAMEVGPFIEAHLGRARKLLASGKETEAIEEARKVLSVDPANAEAQEIAGGSVAAAGQPPSAFDQEGHPAPPSPFAGTRKADEMMASVDLGRHEAETGAGAPADEAAFEMEFEEVAEAAPASAPPGDAKVDQILNQGRALFAQRKYQEAVETWSRVYALDESNAEVGKLIDQANSKIAESSSRVEDAFYRAQDQIDAGNLQGAKKIFEEVLSIQPGHAEALDRIARIDEELSGAAAGQAIRVARRESEAGERGPGEDEAAQAGPSPALERSGSGASSPFAASSHSGPARSGAGVLKRKPVVLAPPRRSAGRLVVVAALAVIVIGGAGAAWWIFLGPGSTASEDGGIGPEPSTAGLPPNASPEEAPEPSDPAPPEQKPSPTPQAKAATSPPRATLDPAETRQMVASLMREGRTLLDQKQYAEAHARFQEVLRLEATNFDAEELRMKASAGMAEEARFDRDLEAAKTAFKDQDWAGCLYKLYRLQQEREGMTLLKRYISNANHNWGVQDLEAFRLDGALEHFKDALEQVSDDRTTQQHAAVAERYKGRRRDPAFDAYVAKVKLRALDGP